ncbi:MAG TPA: ABC transporter ATP-binding protein/permease [Trebonia sp.]|nr:ABC transporter ATP-binding protein/permease [Trebonia sp.]
MRTGAGERLSGWQAWRLLWASSPALSVAVAAWVVASAVISPLVVAALGFVVGAIPGAVEHGLGSGAGRRLTGLLVIAALIYAASLVADPVGSALGTAAQQRITGRLQARLLRAVSAPAGIAHLEDAETLDRLARAEGSLTGFFPGDAPVTWAGMLAGRLSGVIGCAVIAAYAWWLGPLLLVMWVLVRRAMLGSVVRQATDLRGQTTTMRRAWYFTGVGTKARSSKEVRVFGLSRFVAGMYREEFGKAITAGHAGLRGLHARAAACLVAVLAGYAVALYVIADAARAHEIGLRSLAILLPMLSVSMAAGNVSFEDITLAWTLAGLPDVDHLEAGLSPPGQAAPAGTGALAARPAGAAPGPGARLPRESVRFAAVGFRYPGTSRDVLSGVDLELAAGTSTALVGVNGAGKSTLVSLLARLRDPTAGRLLVDGTDVRELDAGTWQRAIALMPQSPVKYPVSVYDNIAFGALEFRDDSDGVQRAAARSGFAAVVDGLPAGWDTIATKDLPGGVDLSGGQWQRLALARALFATEHGARVLVLDEPTAALDVRMEALFYGRFHEITAGLTTLVISHRFATVRRAQQICVLDGGVITERGTHEALVAAGGTYATMYRKQAARFGQ